MSRWKKLQRESYIYNSLWGSFYLIEAYKKNVGLRSSNTYECKCWPYLLGQTFSWHLLEYLPKDIALSVPECFLVLETSDDFQQVYYDSIFTNQLTKRLEIKLHNFWKRSEVFSIPLANFKPHKIFAVKDLLAYKGFKLID